MSWFAQGFAVSGIGSIGEVGNGRTDSSGTVLLWLIVLAIVVVIAVYMLRWLYRRSTKETAFVRTGFLGEKVVVNGGAFVIPVLHEITPVNMNVMRIEVRREDGDGADHQEPHARRSHRRVLRPRRRRAGSWSPPPRRRSAAATLQPEGIRELLEGKFAGGACAPSPPR